MVQATASASESILRKIQRCLALSQSSNENEAATALRQAQKMMDMHGISAIDLKSAELGEAKVHSKASISRAKDWETSLVVIIGKAFGCRLLWTKGYGPEAKFYPGKEGDYFGHFTLIGLKTQVELAEYTIDVMQRKLMKARLAFVASLPAGLNRTAKSTHADGFCKGWVRAVTKTIHAFAMDADMAALLDKRIAERAKGKTAKTQNRGSSYGAAQGMKAGAGESIYRPMNQKAATLRIAA